jgi:hypothetical protein
MRRASASVVASGNSMCTSRPASSAHRDLGVQPGGQAQVDQIHRIDLRELTGALDAFASGFGHHRAGEAAVPGPGAPTPEHLTAKAAAAAQSANGHTARTRGRVSKRITGGRLEGEPDRISGTPSTPAA